MGNYEAQTGFAKGSPIRLGDTGGMPFTQRRPVVDVETLSARAANEVIGILNEHREQQKKAGKSFLKRRQPKPEVDLVTVAESIREAVEEAYRVSGAACVPPVLDLTEEHLAEVQQLQEQATEQFCRQVLRAVKGDTTLEEQVYNLSPALRPLPEPDKAALANLQKRMDEALEDVLEAFQELGNVLKYLDKLVNEEVELLAGTSAVSNRRLKTQAEAMRTTLARRLEAGTDFDQPVVLKVAQW